MLTNLLPVVKPYLRIVIIVMLVVNALGAAAQDIHFSQFYASPLNLNPALTGYSEGDYRVTGIYRNQWNTVTTPFVTYSASYDMRVMPKKLKKDIFGVGGLFVNDVSGNGKLGMLSIMVSSAYHKRLGKNSDHYLGLGIQLGYVQRRLDYNSLTFPSQHDGDAFNTTTASGENFGNNNTGYFDMQAGLLYSTQIKERLGLFAGFTLYHLTQPTESFLGNDAKLAMRNLAHAGLRIKLTERLYLTPNVLFMLQNKAQQVNFGSAIEYHFGKKSDKVIASIGGWYRLEDSGIVSASAEYKRVRLGLSYDVTTSGLKEVPKPTGSFEISLVYLGLFPSNDVGPILVPCPRL